MCRFRSRPPMVGTSQIGMMRGVASAVALANSGDIEAAQLAFSNIISDAELQLQNAKKAA